MARPLAWLVAIAIVLGGCTQRPLSASPRALRKHARSFLQAGMAAMMFPGETRPVRVDADTEISVDIPDGPGLREQRLTIRELVAGCDQPSPPVGVTDPCLAARVIDREVVVAHKRERRVGQVATGVVTGAFVLGVGALCAAECDRTKLALGVAGVAVLVVLLATLGAG